jgi:hypothetical protein
MKTQKNKPNEKAFVKSWALASLKNQTLMELATQLGMPYMQAYNEAKRLAFLGVKFPPLWGMQKTDYAKVHELNNIIEQVKQKGVISKS